MTVTHTRFDGLFELNPQTVRCPHATYWQAREEAPVWVDGLSALKALPLTFRKVV